MTTMAVGPPLYSRADDSATSGATQTAPFASARPSRQIFKHGAVVASKYQEQLQSTPAGLELKGLIRPPPPPPPTQTPTWARTGKRPPMASPNVPRAMAARQMGQR